MSPVGPLGRGHGSQDGVEEAATLMAGEKTGFTWQKCSLRLRECGSDDRLGIRILPATLETMLGGGHSWEAVNDVGDLAGFRDIFAVLLREMTTFAQKVVGIGAPGLLAKWTGL